VRALVSRPPTGGAELIDVPPPDLGPGQVRVRVLEVGICGTDLDIVAGRYGRPPDGASYLILGHENLGVVEEGADPNGPLRPGTLVVATVRRGCGTCAFCAAGRSDFCASGNYTERGIWRANGYLAEEYVESATELVPVPAALRACAVLTEPTSVVEKAIEQGQLVWDRVAYPPGAGPRRSRALVAGAGAVGLLASLLLRLRGWDVTTIDRHGSTTLAAQLLGEAGARHVDVEAGLDALGDDRFDLVVEASGSAGLDSELLDRIATNGVLVLTGIPDASGGTPKALGAQWRRLVLANQAVVGSVNANRTHFAAAVADLGRLAGRWPGLLERLVGERRPWDDGPAVFGHRPEGTIKTALVVRGA
jgi:threonine dehydrogenase-like Zn-dependent dehydrogenase